MTSPFSVLILGSGSAIPRKDRNHTAQILNYNNRYFLIDCGEGTQIRMKQFGISIQKIEAVFISHLHGDHYLGLAGLISSMNLLGREKKLTLYGPERLREVIDLHFSLANSRSSFPIEYVHTSEESEEIYHSEHIRIKTIPLKHKIPTTGFLFEVGSNKRKMVPALLEKYNVPKSLRSGMRDGLDFIAVDGTVIPNSEITADPSPPRTYAFCSDTAFDKDLYKSIQGVNMIYHEATFTDEDKKKAKDNFHSTGSQAATVAQKAKAKKMLIGHFSNKYRDGSLILKEAKSIFKNTEIAKEGEWYEIN